MDEENKIGREREREREREKTGERRGRFCHGTHLFAGPSVLWRDGRERKGREQKRRISCEKRPMSYEKRPMSCEKRSMFYGKRPTKET